MDDPYGDMLFFFTLRQVRQLILMTLERVEYRGNRAIIVDELTAEFKSRINVTRLSHAEHD